MEISPFATSSLVPGNEVPNPIFPPALNKLLLSTTHVVPSQKVVFPTNVPFGRMPSSPVSP